MSEIEKCVQKLNSGGIIIYPTDTVWGIGCDATNEEAVSKLSKLKQRTKEGYIILVCDDRMLLNHVKDIPEVAWELVDSSENPLTLILDNGLGLAEQVKSSDGSVAVRMVKSGFAHEVIKKLKRPITSTSANVSGSPTPLKFENIDQNLISQADYIAPMTEDKSVNSKPSSILKLSQSGEIEIIRR